VEVIGGVRHGEEQNLHLVSRSMVQVTFPGGKYQFTIRVSHDKVLS